MWDKTFFDLRKNSTFIILIVWLKSRDSSFSCLWKVKVFLGMSVPQNNENWTPTIVNDFTVPTVDERE